MKFKSKNGEIHDKRYQAVLSDIRSSIRGEEEEEERVIVIEEGERRYIPRNEREEIFDNEPAPAITPYPDDVTTICINSDTEEIQLVGVDGSILSTAKVDPMIAGGFIKDAIDISLSTVINDQDTIDHMAQEVVDSDFSSIQRVVAAASDHNVVLNPSYSEELIDCIVRNVSTAMDKYPLQTRSDRNGFLKSVLTKLEETLNKYLKQDNSVESEE